MINRGPFDFNIPYTDRRQCAPAIESWLLCLPAARRLQPTLSLFYNTEIVNSPPSDIDPEYLLPDDPY